MSEAYFVTLVRHGESTANAEGRHQGQMDFPLTERGQAQAQALARRWLREGRRYHALIASPLSRALQTAQILADTLNLDIETDPLWMERDNGVLAGWRWEEARERFPIPDLLHLYHPVGDTGESIWDLYLRAGQAIQRLLRRPPGRYLVVSHGGLLHMVLYAILGIAPQPNFLGPRFVLRNTAFVDLEYRPEEGRWRLHGLTNPNEEGFLG
ncbi:MAG TPA: histidine phosphatase family protein [Anaerolineales bacterium]|nr:histidine phosphatase family protein [Anaerolineales bacterium]